MKRLSVISLVMSFVGLIILTGWDQSEAIPAFARKYRTSCSTCHVAYPKLNAFGRGFRQSGYQMPGGDEAYIKEEPASLGAPAWRRVWPNAIWPGQLPGTAPFALRVVSQYVINPSAHVTNDFQLPMLINLHAGGTLGEDIAFIGTYHLYQRGEAGALHQMFLEFQSLFKGKLPRNLLNLKIGRFEPAVIYFSDLSDARQLTPFGYLLTSFDPTVPETAPGVHVHGEEGFRLGSSQSGLELNGVVGKSFQYGVGVVNGNGESPLDNNSDKDIYYRVSYKFGGMSVTGSVEPGQPLKQTEAWIDNSVRIGTFGYIGKAPSEAEEEHEEGEEHERSKAIAGQEAEELVTEFNRFGADVDVWIGDLNVFGAVMRGENKTEHEEVDFTAGFVQGDYVILPWMVGTLRYGVVDRPEGADVKRFVPSLTMSIRANVTATAGAERYLDESGDDRAILVFDFAF